jgi:lysozyme
MSDPYVVNGLRKILTLREGLRDRVYLDSRGLPTGWIGHLILPSDNLKVGDPIPEAVGETWFEHDTAAAIAAAERQAAQAGVVSLDFIIALANVNFQLGVLWTAKFPNTWALIIEGAYDNAIDALDDSAWAKQTPVRVHDFQDALAALPNKPGVDKG